MKNDYQVSCFFLNDYLNLVKKYKY